MDAYEQSSSSWRQMQHEWQMALEGWNDSTTHHFDNRFWQPLSENMPPYLEALERLQDVLRAAKEAVEE